MCQENLIKLTDNMIHEIEAYGPTVCPVNVDALHSRAGTETLTEISVIESLCAILMVIVAAVAIIQLCICVYIKRLWSRSSAEKRDRGMRSQQYENGEIEIEPKARTDEESPNTEAGNK